MATPVGHAAIARERENDPCHFAVDGIFEINRTKSAVVITSKAVTSGPQYTLLITNWKTDAPIAADAFELHAPAGAKKVEFKDLSDIDEVPPGIVKGGKK